VQSSTLDFKTSLDPFLGHFSFPQIISPHAVQLSLHSSPIFSHTPYTKPLKSSKPTTQILHSITIAPPHLRLLPPPVPFPHFTPISIVFSPKPNFSKFVLFVHIFSLQRHIPIHGLCHFLFLCWFIVFLQGVGVDFGGVFQTLVLKLAHHVFVKIPQPIPACLEAKLPLPDPTAPKPQ
jgi:hypothetical protein